MSDGYVLPESIYGLVIAEPLQLDRHVDGNFIYFTELIRCYILLLINYSVQWILMYKIWEINLDKEGQQCDDALRSLQSVCVFIFSISVFSEVRDAFSLFHLLWVCDTVGVVGSDIYHAVDQGGHGAVLEADSSGMNLFGKMNVWAKKKHITQWNLDRMTLTYKMCAIALVAVPKLVIPIALTIVGGNYIMRSEDAETMVLNTLAVLFIIDIDEFLYNTFTTTPMKHQLASMKEIKVEVSNAQRFMGFVFSSFVFPALIIAATGCMVTFSTDQCG